MAESNAKEVRSRAVWAVTRGEWQRIEDPLASKPVVPLPHGEITHEEFAEYRRKRAERFRDAGYSPYPWLDFDPSEHWPMLTVNVYVAETELPHEFLVIIGKEGTEFSVYATDLPSLLQLLRELAPIAQWNVTNEFERERQSALKDPAED